jgi:hypothetical protein
VIVTHVHEQTGVNLIAVIADAAGRRWNGTAFEALDLSRVALCGVPLTESPEGSYSYTLVIPPAIPVAMALTIWLYAASVMTVAGMPNWIAIYRRPAEVEGGGSTPVTGTGNGDTPIDHNTGGVDRLRVTSSGQSVDDALITAYLSDDFNSDVPSPAAQTRTGSDGRWIAPLMLDAGSYVLVVSATHLKPYTVTIIVQ